MLIETVKRALMDQQPEPADVDVLVTHVAGLLVPDGRVVLEVRRIRDYRTGVGSLVEVVELFARPEALAPALTIVGDHADAHGWLLALRRDAPGLVDVAGELDAYRFRPLDPPLAKTWDFLRVPRQLLRTGGNPFRSRSICPACGNPVTVSTRTGRAYSHARPESLDACPGSGAPIPGALQDGQAPPAVPPAVAYSPKPTATNVHRLEEHGSSVRTWRGGLPGLGRRR